MIHKIISLLYEIPFYDYIIIIVCALAFWSTLAFFLPNRRIWKWINAFVFAMTIIIVVLVTLVFRRSELKDFSIIPFLSFDLAKQHSDIYQEMMLNVILYLPVGMTLPFILRKRIAISIIVTLIFALTLSSSTEVFQYFLQRGYAEIDDVIFNTTGSLLGCLPFVLIYCIKRNGNTRNKD